MLEITYMQILRPGGGRPPAVYMYFLFFPARGGGCPLGAVYISEVGGVRAVAAPTGKFSLPRPILECSGGKWPPAPAAAPPAHSCPGQVLARAKTCGLSVK